MAKLVVTCALAKESSPVPTHLGTFQLELQRQQLASLYLFKDYYTIQWGGALQATAIDWELESFAASLLAGPNMPPKSVPSLAELIERRALQSAVLEWGEPEGPIKEWEFDDASRNSAAAEISRLFPQARFARFNFALPAFPAVSLIVGLHSDAQPTLAVRVDFSYEDHAPEFPALPWLLVHHSDQRFVDLAPNIDYPASSARIASALGGKTVTHAATVL